MNQKQTLSTEMQKFAHGEMHARAEGIRINAANKGWLKRLVARSNANVVEHEIERRENLTANVLEEMTTMHESETAMSFLASIAHKAKALNSPITDELNEVLQSSPEELTKRYLLDRERFLFSDQLSSTSADNKNGADSIESDEALSPVTMVLIDAAMKAATPRHKSERVRLSRSSGTITSRYNPAVAAGVYGNEAAADQHENVESVDFTDLKVLYNLVGSEESSPPETPRFSSLLAKSADDKLNLSSLGLNLAINVTVTGPYERTETGGARAQHVPPVASAKVSRL